ncbi:hypothetical protein GGX14DRAFT_394430 [Mycena pura]|uniref:Uncharacterized protein n=1 Tax=Mycena pura TaxID=153505 RepID=A0AAD6YHT4_9AGAR|nr:hypothetical protein GGX14DRAFT_394430 [Mycena pura]
MVWGVDCNNTTYYDVFYVSFAARPVANIQWDLARRKVPQLMPIFYLSAGSAVYIYGIDQTGEDQQADIAFTLGNIQSTHHYTGSEAYVYHALFFSATGLAVDDTHTVSWVLDTDPSIDAVLQLTLFDYAIVTRGTAAPTADAPTAATPSATPAADVDTPDSNMSEGHSILESSPLSRSTMQRESSSFGWGSAGQAADDAPFTTSFHGAASALGNSKPSSSQVPRVGAHTHPNTAVILVASLGPLIIGGLGTIGFRKWRRIRHRQRPAPAEGRPHRRLIQPFVLDAHTRQGPAAAGPYKKLRDLVENVNLHAESAVCLFAHNAPRRTVIEDSVTRHDSSGDHRPTAGDRLLQVEERIAQLEAHITHAEPPPTLSPTFTPASRSKLPEFGHVTTVTCPDQPGCHIAACYLANPCLIASFGPTAYLIYELFWHVVNSSALVALRRATLRSTSERCAPTSRSSLRSEEDFSYALLTSFRCSGGCHQRSRQTHRSDLIRTPTSSRTGASTALLTVDKSTAKWYTCGRIGHFASDHGRQVQKGKQEDDRKEKKGGNEWKGGRLPGKLRNKENFYSYTATPPHKISGISDTSSSGRGTVPLSFALGSSTHAGYAARAIKLSFARETAPCWQLVTKYRKYIAFGCAVAVFGALYLEPYLRILLASLAIPAVCSGACLVRSEKPTLRSTGDAGGVRSSRACDRPSRGGCAREEVMVPGACAGFSGRRDQIAHPPAPLGRARDVPPAETPMGYVDGDIDRKVEALLAETASICAEEAGDEDKDGSDAGGGWDGGTVGLAAVSLAAFEGTAVEGSSESTGLRSGGGVG